MLRDEIELYERLTGKDANSVSVAVMGAFLDGYEIGKKENEPKKGKWIVDGHHYICSNCGKTLALMFSECDDDDLIGCPFCLADMREADNDK